MSKLLGVGGSWPNISNLIQLTRQPGGINIFVDF